MSEPTVPCLGHHIHSVNGDDFDCDYEHAPTFCEDCVVNGGKVDPTKPREEEELGGADFVEMKDGTKIIILGDVHHKLAEVLTRHHPKMVDMLPMPLEHIIPLADAVMNGGPRRRAELMTSFAEIYGEPCKIVAEIYKSVDKGPEKKGQAPDFIKERNRKHWRRR